VKFGAVVLLQDCECRDRRAQRGAPCSQPFSSSGNSKSGQRWSEWQAALNRHGFQRVCKFRTAVTAHPVGHALQREHAAEVNVVTPKEEIEEL
jgi:hypothetical protein